MEKATTESLTIESYRLDYVKDLVNEAYARIHDAYNRYPPGGAESLELLREAHTRLVSALNHLEEVRKQVASQI